MNKTLIETYGEARLPRYTSYPTAPLFSSAIGSGDCTRWLAAVPSGSSASLYLHVPFCRAMCWYCGCHTTITERDQPILDYLETLKAEIRLVGATRREPLDIADIHFGGGTPTIISADNFLALMGVLRENFAIDAATQIAVEIDPRTLRSEMAGALAEAGVTRASLGVQSFDPVVQKAINRVQSVETTARAVSDLRANGIDAINFDLIYGLPFQTVRSCVETVEAAIAMRPDRFSVFGYAHVPGFKKHQRLIDEQVLAGAQARNEQAEAIAQTLVAKGYQRIGLDHFALPQDALAIAATNGRLHRNFQGYTTDQCTTLIGLGASSIGRFAEGYVQNEVPLGLYGKRIAAGELATTRGYALTAEDRLRAEVIERLMCDFRVDLTSIALSHGCDPMLLSADNNRLRALIDDGVVDLEAGILQVRDGHRFMIRAVASAFDAYLDSSGRSFSKAA
ncbi:oxygen-independent coproporphyrinogen III oxidase [Pararhizobium antarcticum]|uniref:Coproporphyrinogen-III oxidase n=1 Tax=Pararhizobium antarcticum TaxID=1798805 RepID=A0A657LUU1_9HYPH|nr:oxygen-independent coproporphyrinogen III oxidase [Pararhizobium antarcticum]OJF92736.1 coproporphyrinogen III oxidase [Rhizobium sp. 58]OJF95098.1 coproporphyrinogen III oxidase [Pararhizobium antarcticum]